MQVVGLRDSVSRWLSDEGHPDFLPSIVATSKAEKERICEGDKCYNLMKHNYRSDIPSPLPYSIGLMQVTGPARTQGEEIANGCLRTSTQGWWGPL